jgi:hypothetical protein
VSALLVLAHAGHWLPQLLYLAPLAVVVVALVVGRVRERRAARADARAGSPDRQAENPSARRNV